MKIRIIDAALLVIAVAGGLMAFGSGRKLHELQTEYKRLTQTAGELVVTDPDQLHVVALKTDEPFHFAWRVYAPKGQVYESMLIGDVGRGSGSSYHSEPSHFIARIRFTELHSGQIAMYCNFGSGASYSSVGSVELLQFLREHWNELEIQQLGADGPARLKQGEPGTLLRIHMPNELAEEARSKIKNPNAIQMIPSVFESRVELKP